jgi:PAS domain S-box-containing protein
VTEEVLQYRKDGTTYWTSLRITPVPDSAGTVTHYISSQTDITQARQARLERDALTRDLQTLVAAIPGVLMRHRPRTDVFWDRTFIAPGVEALTGYTVEEASILGWWLAGTSEHDQRKLYAALNDALGGGQSRTDFRFRRKDGVLIWIRILMRGNVAPDGEREVISIWSDISEEYRMAAEREAKTRELETVMATIPGVIIRTRREPDGSWKRIQVARSITELTGHSVEEAMAEDWWPANAEPGSVLRAKAFFQSENVMAPWEGEFQFRHKLGHWIWIRRRSRGYVDEYGAEEQVSIWNDVTAQKNLLLEREKLTADLQHVITTMPGVMMRVRKNEEGRWFRHFVSPSVEALTGFTVEEAQRADWLPNNLDPADRASMLALLAEGDPLAPETTYFRFRHKQGHTLWIMRNTRGYLDAAGRVEVISIWNDITAEKSLAVERERLAADLQRVITTMPGVLIHAQKDPDGRWVRRFISPAIEALTGFTVEEAHAADWWSNGIDPQDRDRMMAMMYQGDLSKPTATDFRFRHKQGHTIWIHRNTRGFLGLDGQPEAISIWNDITAEKRLLLDQEAMANDLQRVITTMPGVLIRVRKDSEGRWVPHFIAPSIEALTGFTVAEAQEPNWWLDHVHPAEREKMRDILYQTDISRSSTTDFRFRHKQGHYIWINRTTSGFLNAAGQPELISIWNDVSAERRLLFLQKELANDLQAVIKAMPGGLIRARLRHDHTWLHYFVSAGMEVMTGYTIAEMVQQDWARDTLHPDDRPALEASLKREAAGLPTTLEFRLRHKLGHYIWINRRTSSFRNAEGEMELVVIWSDVTAERQLLADRDELASDLQAVMDAMPGVLMRIRNGGDRWDRIYVAPGIEALTGHSVAEAMQPEWVEENLDPGERGLLVGQMRGQFTEHQLSVEFRFRHKKGHWIWIRRIARGHLDPDGTREIIAIWNDVTREKSLGEQLAQSAKLAQLGEMATGMAHELNQPLAGISMAAENALRSLARLPEPPERAQQKLALIVDLTKRASDIVDHMRIFGRTETAGREPVPLAEVVSGAQTLLANKLHAAGVRLEVSLPTGLPPVLGKPVPLEQVLMNLISNACDAYAGRPEPVPAERRVISVSAHAEADWITIEVQDAAGGIPEEVLPRIFEPFFTTKRVGEGTGLGLSISYGIISDMGGTITAENHAGGCLMRILLPVAG